jgi:hypothetical protein
MTDEQAPIEYCDCEACRLLATINELARKTRAALMARGVRVHAGPRPFPPQPKGACQSGRHLEQLMVMTRPIRERTHGQAQATAAQAVEWYPNDHDDDDDV